jgi:hypothetical protein
MGTLAEAASVAPSERGDQAGNDAASLLVTAPVSGPVALVDSDGHVRVIQAGTFRKGLGIWNDWNLLMKWTCTYEPARAPSHDPRPYANGELASTDFQP